MLEEFSEIVLGRGRRGLAERGFNWTYGTDEKERHHRVQGEPDSGAQMARKGRYQDQLHEGGKEKPRTGDEQGLGARKAVEFRLDANKGETEADAQEDAGCYGGYSDAFPAQGDGNGGDAGSEEPRTEVAAQRETECG